MIALLVVLLLVSVGVAFFYRGMLRLLENRHATLEDAYHVHPYQRWQRITEPV
jgi:hypothetical protein